MRIVVLGAGYAGLTLARRLEDALPSAADLVVVNDSPLHLVQHELHRAIRRPEVVDAITVPLEDVLDHAEIVVDRVESIDRDARRVDLASGDALVYDYAAVCLGAETAFYDLPGVEEHGLPLKRLDHAERIRKAFFATPDGGTIVVGGAGLSGVQVAGELASFAREEGMEMRVVLVEQLDAVAPGFPTNFQRAVHDALEERGVEIRTATPVRSATAESIELDDGSLPYDAFVWTGGIRGTGAAGGERPVVRSDLRLDARTFAVGDAARIVDADGEAVPASASAAIREARVVASNLDRLVRHDVDAGDDFAPHLRPYRFDVPGWIVSIGDGAVAQVGPAVVTGAAARAMKATVGAGHLGSVGAIEQAAELVGSELNA